ncbi:MAG TPA: carbohydrate ABC transporter permease [Clostridia bacterium]|nr:carbohydrate ABC transporter permease [Clostridia bacterium]
MKIKRSAGERLFDACNVAFMLMLICVTLYPFLHALFASLSLPSALVKHRGLLLRPLGFTLDSYGLVFSNPMLLPSYANTLFLVTIGTAINVSMTVLSGYVQSKRQAMAVPILNFLVVFTMLFSGGLIPSYLLVSKTLGLNNSYWALVLPGAIGTYNMMVMRSGFMAVPDSLEESATIDGAGEWTVLLRIVLPLTMPTVAVIILFYGVGHWNSWFNAMVYLRSREKYPLQLILREILISNNTSNMTTDAGGLDKEAVGETVKYGTIMVATLPIVCVYPFLQRFFVKGVMIGAVKG